MAETIYTIPVSEAFETDCECPVCELEKRFENDTVQYFVGPSLMEPDTRILTNDKGFCDRHFQLMYNTQANRLGLGLMIDTYLQEQMKKLDKIAGSVDENENGKKSLFGGKKTNGSGKKVSDYIGVQLQKCAICEKLNYTMERYTEIIISRFFHEDEFREKIKNGKGFCLPHLKMLLDAAEKSLSASKYSEFANTLIKTELSNLDRIEKEVDWFTKKFDYRNTEKPWGNSRDAIPRAINKISGAKDIKA